MGRIGKFLTNPKVRFGYFSHLGFYNRISDEKYLRREYYYSFGKNLNLDSPKTFNEKLQWLKIHDRKPIYTTMVDKAEAKKYVASIIGEKYIIPTIGVYEKFDDIDFDKLPSRFVMKCTHDSGGIIICKDKTKLDKKEARKKINKFLKRKYYYVHREWPYKNVKPRIIVEEYMEDEKTSGLVDYKVMCFNGQPKIVFTCTDRFDGGLKVTFFDLEWKRLPFGRHYPVSKKAIPKPKNLKKMIELSKQLSEGIPFVRLDWYEINGSLYFGEFTFYPGAGLEEFEPEEWDKKIGELIKLESVYDR